MHGLLASYLAFHDAKGGYDPWKAIWPSLQDFKACMPILWSDELWNPSTRSLLPSAIRRRPGLDQASIPQRPKPHDLLYHQEQKLLKDWGIVSAAVPNALFDEFVYSWLIVNTRSLYHKFEGPARKSLYISAEDCMVLCPLIDNFNHQDHGVSDLSRWQHLGLKSPHSVL